MTSEADEFFYHEAMVHPAAMVHPFPERALVASGARQEFVCSGASMTWLPKVTCCADA